MFKSSPDFFLSKIPDLIGIDGRLVWNRTRRVIVTLLFFMLTLQISSTFRPCGIVWPHERTLLRWHYLRAVVYDGHDGMLVMNGR